MLTTVIKRAIHTATNAVYPQERENFKLNDALASLSDRNKSVSGKELITVIITFIIVLFILAFIGQFLWNAFIAGDGGTGLITCARPASSVWQILGLYIFVGLFFG